MKKRQRKPRQYVRYTEVEKRWLERYARRMGFMLGSRTADHAWDDIGRDFERKFGRKVHPGRLAFQARLRWKIAENK